MHRALRLFTLALPLCLLAAGVNGAPAAAQPKPPPAKTATAGKGPPPKASASASASAAPVSLPAPNPLETDSDKADALYRQALDAGKAEDWQKTYELLIEAVRLKQSHDILGNLGTAEHHLKRYRDAAEHFTASLKLYPVNGRPEGKAFSQSMLDEARAQVGTLALKITPVTARVRVNGREYAAADRDAVFVDPGEATVEVGGLPGYESARKTVKVEKGREQTVSLDLGPLDGANERSRVPAFVLGGLSLAGLVAGGALLGVGFSTNSDISAKMPRDAAGNPLCQRPPVTGLDRPECVELRARTSEANTFANAGIGLMAVGGLAAAGTVLYLLWPASKPVSAKPAGRVVPTLGDHAGGLVWTGSF